MTGTRIIMDKSLRTLLDDARTPAEQYALAGISADGVKHYILSEMETAVVERDGKTWYVLYGMACRIEDPHVRTDVFNHLLIMPGHTLHQELAMQIQELGDPSSVAFIGSILESQFDFLQYSCSEDESITKWFSHALAQIDTPESIAMIRKHALSPNRGIARGMRYRLRQMKKWGWVV